MTRGRIIAALDIGSNTIKLTVADVSGGRVTPIAGLAEVIRIGEGVTPGGRLREDRIELAVTTIQGFVGFARARGAASIHAVATEAVRTAANGQEFLDRLKSDAGIDARAIDGAEEAALTSAGVLSQIDPGGRILIVDIGGGSTELIAAQDGDVSGSTSLPIGSGNLTDAHVHTDPPLPGELDAIEQVVLDVSGPYFAGQVHAFERLVLVGGAGEYLMIVLGASGPVPVAQIEQARRTVLTRTAAELAATTGAPLVRARVLPAGFSIARAIARRSGSASVESVANGLRIGLLLAAAELGKEQDQPS